MRLRKMTVAKKIRAKQLKKNVPYKNDCGEKNQPNSVGQKNMCLIKMIVAKRIGAKQLTKKLHLIKMTAAKKKSTKQCRIKNCAL